MKRVVLYDPALSSINLGDQIIVDAANEHLAPLLEGAFTLRVSTHLPVSLRYAPLLRDADAKFVLGTNLLMGRSRRGFRQWDVNIATARFLAPAVLMGVGWWKYNSSTSKYTSALYRTILNKNALHSVRDEYTARELRAAGIKNVLNTGCPTLWSLTPTHCKAIPNHKSPSVVTTVTDYHKDPASDIDMLQWLVSEYKNVMLWPQGYFDGHYLSELSRQVPGIKMLDPTLASYNSALQGDVEFIGTRLHAGIRALQHGKRSIIVSVDNRAKEMSKDFGLPTVARGDLDALKSMARSEFETSLHLPWDAIARWKDENGTPPLSAE